MPQSLLKNILSELQRHQKKVSVTLKSLPESPSMDCRGQNKRLAHKINHSNTKWTNIIVHFNPPPLPNCHRPEILQSYCRFWMQLMSWVVFLFICFKLHKPFLPQYLWLKISSYTKYTQLINGVVQSPLGQEGDLEVSITTQDQKKTARSKGFPLLFWHIALREGPIFEMLDLPEKSKTKSGERQFPMVLPTLFITNQLA